MAVFEYSSAFSYSLSIFRKSCYITCAIKFDARSTIYIAKHYRAGISIGRNRNFLIIICFSICINVKHTKQSTKQHVIVSIFLINFFTVLPLKYNCTHIFYYNNIQIANKIIKNPQVKEIFLLLNPINFRLFLLINHKILNHFF